VSKRIKQALGIDIGGSGVKAAVVDARGGELVSERVRLKTPRPATPDAVLETAARIRRKLDWNGPVGCGFPGTLRDGKVVRAPNLEPSWIGLDLATALRRSLEADRVAIGNDADAAGLAEIRLGAGRGVRGTVVLLTLGTGIGTAVFTDGVLLPGTELGHLEMGGRGAETVASESAKIRNNWSWKRWSRGLANYLVHLEYLLHVDLFILGGGASKKANRFIGHLDEVGCKIVVAQMGNLAGIVGAALMVADQDRTAS
jgi:polyphosphate glucokinase